MRAADHPADSKRNSGFSLRLWIIIEFLDFCQEFLGSEPRCPGMRSKSSRQVNQSKSQENTSWRPHSYMFHNFHGPLLVSGDYNLHGVTINSLLHPMESRLLLRHGVRKVDIYDVEANLPFLVRKMRNRTPTENSILKWENMGKWWWTTGFREKSKKDRLTCEWTL